MCDPTGDIAAIVDTATQAASDVGSAVSSAASDVGNAVATTAGDIGTAVASTASDIGSAVSSGASAVGDFLGGTAAAATPDTSIQTDVLPPPPTATPGAGPSDAAAALGATTSPAPAAAIPSAPPPGAVAPGGVVAPQTGGVVSAGAVGDVSQEAIAAQSGNAGGLTGGPAPTTNVGDLLNEPQPKGGDQVAFGADNIPQQVAEGKPAAPTADPGFFSKGGGLNDILNSPVTRLAASTAPLAGALFSGTPPLPAASAALQPGGEITSPLLSAEKQLLAAGTSGQVPGAVAPLAAGGAVTKPLIDTETTQLDAANAGKLTPGQQAQIDTFKQNASNQLFQQLANSGVNDPMHDSRYVQGLADIDRQAMGMQATFIQQSFTTGTNAAQAASANLQATQNFINTTISQGFTAAGAAAGALGTAVNEQIANDNEFQRAMASAMESFGLIMGATTPRTGTNG